MEQNVGTVTPETQPQTGSGNEPTVTPPATATGTPQTGATVPAGQQQPQSRQFDPKDFVPRHRLDEATNKAKTREEALQRELEAERKKIQALTGVIPQSPEEQEFEAARKVLEKWYPGLAKLTDTDFVKKIEALQTTADNLQTQTEEQWTNRGRQAFRELEGYAKKELGGAELGPRGVRALRAAFVDYVSNDEEAGKAYSAGDEEVVKGFWEEYRKTFIDPVRRTSNAAVIQRQTNLRLPRGGGSTPNAPAPKKPDFKNEDDVHNSAWEAIKQRFAE